ncbi:MAG: hypothetical protein ACOYKA_02410 [Legionellaceae bacterium]
MRTHRSMSNTSSEANPLFQMGAGMLHFGSMAIRSYATQLYTWGGVLLGLGGAALAVAFLAFNAASLSLVGLTVAGCGAVASIIGLGLFSGGIKHSMTANQIDDLATLMV